MAMEWSAFLLRWLHIVAAIAWVGASFYFIWAENALIRGGKQRAEGVAGHLWLVHGGGFYYLEKQSAAPRPLPPNLHWFKWEAYATWFSGAALLTLLYYFNADSVLLVAGSDLPPAAGIAIGVGFLVAAWGAYAGLSATPLLKRPLWFAAVGLTLTTLSAWGLLAVFSPRAVLVHIGAMLATLMAGNVLMVIIPAQRRLVAAAERGEVLPASAGVIPGLRSLHNNYLTLPVVFLMIGIHMPLLATTPLAPLTVALLILFAGCLRHVINLSNKQLGLHRGWLAAAAAFLLLAVASARPPMLSAAVGVGAAPADIAAVMPLLRRHCAGCHAAAPTDKVFRSPPLGFVLETPAQAEATKELIYRRVVVDRSMPFNNQTGMTDDERGMIARWARTE